MFLGRQNEQTSGDISIVLSLLLEGQSAAPLMFVQDLMFSLLHTWSILFVYEYLLRPGMKLFQIIDRIPLSMSYIFVLWVFLLENINL